MTNQESNIQDINLDLLLRPRGRPRVNPDIIARAAALVQQGFTVSAAAKAVRVGRATLVRHGVCRRSMGSWKGKPNPRPYPKTLMSILESAVPPGVHDDIRDEIIQQLAVIVLGEDQALSVIRERAIEIKKQTLKLYHDKFKMVSLDEPVSDGERSATRGELMVG